MEWYLRPKGRNRTIVVMEECVYGAGAKDLRQKDPAVLPTTSSWASTH